MQTEFRSLYEITGKITDHNMLVVPAAKLKALTLYEKLAEEYGLSIFPDLKALAAEIETLRTDLAEARMKVETLTAQLAAQQPGAAYASLPSNWLSAIELLRNLLIGQFGPLVGVSFSQEEAAKLTAAACVIGNVAEQPNDIAKQLYGEIRACHGQAPASKIEGLTAAQESLGVEFEKVLHNNLFDLYEESAPRGQAPAQAAPAAVAGPSEAVKFTDQSTADPVEKARRYLTAMGDQRTNSAYFYDDGYPRRESAQDALATLAVLEQLAAAPTTQTAQTLTDPEPEGKRVEVTMPEAVRQRLLFQATRETFAKLGQSARNPAQDKALKEVVGCFEAAKAEGLQEALAETTDERLKDLVERRLMYALYAARAAQEGKSHDN